MSESGLTVWVICFSPKDFPGKFTVRPHVLLDGEYLVDPLSEVTDSLEAARSHVPAGLHCMPRQPDDFLCVVETWF